MIRNVIFVLFKVLVEWEPMEAMRRLGMDEKTARAVADATVNTPDWDESDRGLLSPDELLSRFIGKAPEYEKKHIPPHFPGKSHWVLPRHPVQNIRLPAAAYPRSLP